MIEIYFGLPRTGKTTLLAKKALQLSRQITSGKCPYKQILGNVDLIGIPHYRKISFDMLGKYCTTYSAILIDETTIEADSRQFKSFPKYQVDFLVLHGHALCDLFFFCQIFNRIDATIRMLANNVYYMYKIPLLGRWFTHMYRIPYSIQIPDPKKSDTEKFGEIVAGFHKPDIITRLLTPPLFRVPYYKYFDSWVYPDLPPLPEIGWRDGEVIPLDLYEPPYIPPTKIDIRSHLH